MVDETSLAPAVQDALALIRRHPRVRSAVVQAWPVDRTQVDVEFDTDLPSRWRAEGQSPTGVRAIEPVLMVFAAEYPRISPGIYLRKDFNRSLPHINPHRAGDYVPPCVVFGGATEFFHREGLGSLLDQIALWLRNAGRDELISLTQGWEPVRRDEISSYLTFDPGKVTGLITDRPRHAYVETIFAATRPKTGPLGIAAGRLGQARKHINAKNLEQVFNSSIEDGYLSGKTLTILCWAGDGPSGEPFVCKDYLPETVSTYADLLDRADAYGCGEPLRAAINWLRRCAQQFTRKHTYPLFFTLAARRPAVVIGTASEYELLAYRMDLTFPQVPVADAAIKVVPVAHCHPVTGPLLRRMSGVDPDSPERKLTLIGCGSLGSKIATHLARAGLPPTGLLDSGRFRPHNAARHALFPSGDTKSPLPPSKAQMLAGAFSEFGAPAPIHHDGDFLTLAAGTVDFTRLFPADLAIVLNTTASHGVRDQLSVLGQELPGRVVEGALADDGRIALLSLEGRDRNPDTTDLISGCYEDLRAQGRLAALAGLSTRPTRIAIGVGCDSVTQVMSDARVSLHAATMGGRLAEWSSKGLPDHAFASVGTLDDDEMSTAWRRLEVGATHVVVAENDETWTVRVLDRAHRRIVDEVGRWPRVETGGVIVGRVSPIRRIAYVTDVIEAPPDSRRSAGVFALGTDGLLDAVDAYEAAGAGALWCLGTWHSHLVDRGGSRRDYQTANMLEGRGRNAVVMLIRRPSGYSAIVKPGGWPTPGLV